MKGYCESEIIINYAKKAFALGISAIVALGSIGHTISHKYSNYHNTPNKISEDENLQNRSGLETITDENWLIANFEIVEKDEDKHKIYSPKRKKQQARACDNVKKCLESEDLHYGFQRYLLRSPQMRMKLLQEGILFQDPKYPVRWKYEREN